MMPDMRIARAPQARFESTCTACGEKVWKGAPIVRHSDTREYVHAKCQFRRDDSNRAEDQQKAPSSGHPIE